ncbi:unannotated protein [freshwater metagenome]|uniref:Unannotated protein n=1 Tax=freshwater metagenome TaxID=449393 RepID=A0A6J6SJE1_9ZZZZ
MTSQDLLRERYGAPAPWRRRALIAASGVLVLAFVGWLAWTTWVHATPAVDSEMVGFDVLDEHAVEATVAIKLQDGVDADCLLRAFAEDHTTVGELSFTPTGTGRTVETIRTEREATSVELVGCTAPGQPRPR